MLNICSFSCDACTPFSDDYSSLFSWRSCQSLLLLKNTFIVIYMSVQRSTLQCSLQYECEDWGWGSYIRSLHGGNRCSNTSPRPSRESLRKGTAHQVNISHICPFNSRDPSNALTVLGELCCGPVISTRLFTITSPITVVALTPIVQVEFGSVRN